MRIRIKRREFETVSTVLQMQNWELLFLTNTNLDDQERLICLDSKRKY